MTLTEALTLKAGDVITSKPLAGAPDMPRTYELTLAFPARPEMGYAPSILGRTVLAGKPELSRNCTMQIILDGDKECMKALAYWTKIS
jgi:hypothetical protein